jgi:hypothetical protein
MYFISYQRYHVRAVQFSGTTAHEQTKGNSFVGVRCPQCEAFYAVSIPPCKNNDSILLDAIEGTLRRLNICGSHPSEISFSLMRYASTIAPSRNPLHIPRVALEDLRVVHVTEN